MDGKLIVSSSPHISSTVKTKNIMLDVIIAMIPALIASVFYFGPRALALVCVTVAACVISEYISRKVMKREQTIWHSTTRLHFHSGLQLSVVS